MSKPYNPASRVLALIDAVFSHPDGSSVLMVWRQILSVAADDVTVSYKVAAKLALVFEEIELLEAQLRRENILGPDMYLPALNQAREAFTPLRLGSSIGGVKAILQGEHHRTFQMLVAIIRTNEVEASFDEIQELHGLISDMQEMIAASNLSPQLIALLQNHVDALRRAISSYQINGPRCISEALRLLQLEMLPAEEAILAQASSPEFTLLQKIWAKATAVAVPAGTVNDLYGVAQLGFVAAAQVIELVKQ
jgi:hypothetical protein